MTTAELIDTAHTRLLTTKEQSQLILGLYKGTPASFVATVNRAYALAKKYDSFGGSKVYAEMQSLFDTLGSSDFRVLYGAVKLAA
jgi:hypothetical protein